MRPLWRGFQVVRRCTSLERLHSRGVPPPVVLLIAIVNLECPPTGMIRNAINMVMITSFEVPIFSLLSLLEFCDL